MPAPIHARTLPPSCPTCDGSRRVVSILPGMPPGLNYVTARCPTCDATGTDPAATPDPLAPGPWDALPPHPGIKTSAAAPATAGEISGVR